MGTIHFVDTSVFANLLNIPGLNESYSQIKNEYDSLKNTGDTFILPVATLIETGNHIAHIPDGRARYSCAEKFVDIVTKAAVQDTNSNWSITPQLSNAVLDNILNDFTEFAKAEVGFGDLSIIKQFDEYWMTRQPIGRIRIWSIDEDLQGNEHEGGLKRRRMK